MSERIHLTLARIFTRMFLAGAVMLPVLGAQKVAGDTQVRVSISTPNARVKVARGYGNTRASFVVGAVPHRMYRSYPVHRHYRAPRYVIVREPVYVYRDAPSHRHWSRTPDYRYRDGYGFPGRQWGRSYYRGDYGSYEGQWGRNYNRGDSCSRGGQRGRGYEQGGYDSYDSPQMNRRSGGRNDAYVSRGQGRYSQGNYGESGIRQAGVRSYEGGNSRGCRN